MPDEEIGWLNLKEYDALLKRKKNEDNLARLNAGIIAAAVYNTAAFGDPNRRVVIPTDFVPEWRQPDWSLGNLTPEEQKEYMLRLFRKHMK